MAGRKGVGDMRVAAKRSLLGLIVGAVLFAGPFSDAQADVLTELVDTLRQASSDWGLNAPSGAEILILQNAGNFTVHSGEDATAEDRRWAAQVRSGIILAQRAGAHFEDSVIAQASYGLWSIRLEDGIEVMAADAAQALATFLSGILEQPQTPDLNVVIDFLENALAPAARIAPGGIAHVAIPNEAMSGVSVSGDIGVTPDGAAGAARIDVAPNAKAGYHTLYLFGGESRFTPIAARLVKVDTAPSEF
ncbi:MAG: hypothetical protein RLN70_05850 [Rhodospirillaceae bacterium]